MGNGLSSQPQVNDDKKNVDFEDSKWASTPISLLLDESFIQEKYVELFPEDSVAGDSDSELEKNFDDSKPSMSDLEHESDMALLQLFAASSLKQQQKMEAYPSVLSDGRKELTMPSSAYRKKKKIYKKQMALLSRYYKALGRQNESSAQKEAIVPSSETSSTKTIAQVLFSTASFKLQLGMLTSLKGSHPELFESSFKMIIDTIASFEPLCLRDLPSGSAEKFGFDALCSLCEDMLQSTSTSDSEISLVCAMLLALGVSSGRSHCLLRLWSILERRCCDKFPPVCVAEACDILMQRFISHTVTLEETSFEKALQKFELKQLPFQHSNNNNIRTAIANDGKYLYIWDLSVLRKIGTGLQGTVAGKVYLENYPKLYALSQRNIEFQAYYGQIVDVTREITISCKHKQPFVHEESHLMFFLSSMQTFCEDMSDGEREAVIKHFHEAAVLYVEFYIGTEDECRSATFQCEDDIVLPPPDCDLEGEITIRLALFGVFDTLEFDFYQTHATIDESGVIYYGRVSKEYLDVENEENLYLKYGEEALQQFRYGEQITLKTGVSTADKSISQLLCVADFLYLYMEGLCNDEKSLCMIQKDDLSVYNTQATWKHVEGHTSSEVKKLESGTQYKEGKLMEDILAEASILGSDVPFSATTRNAFTTNSSELWKAECSENNSASIVCTFHTAPRRIIGYRICASLPTDSSFHTRLSGRDDFSNAWTELHNSTLKKAAEGCCISNEACRKFQSYCVEIYYPVADNDREIDKIEVVPVSQIEFYESNATELINESGSSNDCSLSKSSNKVSTGYFSDGRYVYHAKYIQKIQSIEVTVLEAKCDSEFESFSLVRNVCMKLSRHKLQEELGSFTDTEFSKLLLAIHSLNFYSDGDRFYLSVPLSEVFTVLKFDSHTGEFVGSKTCSAIDGTELADSEYSSFSFDSLNNLIWSYNSTSASVSSFCSEGVGGGGRTTDTSLALEWESIKIQYPTDVYGQKDFDAFNTMHLIMALDKFSAPYAIDRTFEKEILGCAKLGKEGGVPFSIDSSDSAIEILADTIVSKISILVNETRLLSSLDFYTLRACLRILAVYLSHAPASSDSIKEYYTKASTSLLPSLLQLLNFDCKHNPTVQVGPTIDCAVHLFAAGIDLFYPNCAAQLDLVIGNLEARKSKTLSSVEESIMELLMRRLAAPSSSISIVSQEKECLLKTFTQLCKFAVDSFLCKLKLLESFDRRQENFAIDEVLVDLISALSKALMLHCRSEEVSVFIGVLCNKCEDIATAVEAYLLEISSLSDEEHEWIDILLKQSLLGTVLPTVLASLSLVICNENNASTRKEIQLVTDHVQSFTKLLGLIGALCHNSAYFSDPSIKEKSVTCEKSKTMTKEIESAHPYENNCHSFVKLSVPGAETLVIEFDPQSKTESGYDYLTFYKDASRSEFWGNERYSGRNGDENWAGVDGRSALVIESDSCVIHFHSDSSGVDWGYKFSVSSEVKSKWESTSLHWLLQVEEALATLLEHVSIKLIGGSDLTPYRDVELDNAHFLDSHLIYGGQQNEVEVSKFLGELVDPIENSRADAIVGLLRRTTMEDQGTITHVNKAVRAVGAAILHHNLLGMDAYALAQNKRDEPSKEMLKGWKNAQKMRRWFDFGDAAESHAHRPIAPSGRRLRRQPSAFKGASEEALLELCDLVTKRAQFLLTLTPVAFSLVQGARKRWGLLAKYGHALYHRSDDDEGTAVSSSEKENLIEKWYNVVNEFHATIQLKELFQYRRSSSHRRTGKQFASITEFVLEFVQSDVHTDELEHLMELRNIRAVNRIEGIQMLLSNCNALSNNHRLLTRVLESFSKTMRDVSTREYCAESVHFFNGLSGCKELHRKTLTEEYGKLLTYLVSLFQFSNSGEAGRNRLNSICSNNSVCSVASTYNAEEAIQHRSLVIAALKSSSMDYEVPDSFLLHESRILPKLLVLISMKESVQIRRIAQSILRILLSRFVAVDDDLNQSKNAEKSLAVHPEVSDFQKQLLTSVRLQLEGVAEEWERVKKHRNVSNAVELRRNSPGPCAKHIPLGWEFSIHFWVYVWDESRAYSLRVGDHVGLVPEGGKDYNIGDQKNSRGEVISVDGNVVVVRWLESRDVQSFAWDSENLSREIMLLDHGPGGSIVAKGTKSLASADELSLPWRFFSIELTDSLHPRLIISGGHDQSSEEQLTCATALQKGTWTHLAVVLDQNRVKFYFNGRTVYEDMLRDAIYEPLMIESKSLSGKEHVVESQHPYQKSTNRYWNISIPGSSLVVTFDPQSETASSDYVRFLKDDSLEEYWGESKYCGGSPEFPGNFPGVQQSQLIIPSDRVTVYFHSETNSNNWGFRLTIRGEESARKLSKSVLNFNNYPIYFGELPLRVADTKAADCCVSELNLLPRSFNSTEVKDAMNEANSLHSRRPKQFPKSRALEVLSLVHACCSTPVGRSFISNAGTIKNLLALARMKDSPSSIRCSAYGVLKVILPTVSQELVNTQLNALKQGMSEEKSNCLVAVLMDEIGQKLNVWKVGMSEVAHFTEIEKKESASNAFDEVKSIIQLIKSLARTEEWIPTVISYMKASLQMIPKIVDPEKRKKEGTRQYVQQIYATLALLGGNYNSISAGSRVKCSLDIDGREGIEVGTVIEMRLRDDMRIARVILDCDLHEVYDIPLVDVTYYLDTDEENDFIENVGFLYKHMANEFSDILPGLETLLRYTDPQPAIRHLPQIIKQEKVQVLESDHPYSNDMDASYPIDFPGATEIELEFDSLCSTEEYCDYIRLNKRGQTGFWGEERYSGASFARLASPLKVIVPASSLDLYFHSDSSNTDWGFKVTARAQTKISVEAPETPHDSFSLCMSDLRCRLLKVMSKMFSVSSVLPPLLPLLKPIVKHAISTYIGCPIRPMPKTQIFESKHPYCNSISEYMTVNFSGATELTIVFDAASKTENGCDYVVFYKDKSLQDRWGDQQYTGRGGAENWPGCNGRAPLVINSDCFTLYWCTDGSNVDWGWKFTVTAHFPSVQPIDSPLAQLDQRAYFVSECQHEEPKAQEFPTEKSLLGFRKKDGSSESGINIDINKIDGPNLQLHDAPLSQLVQWLAKEDWAIHNQDEYLRPAYKQSKDERGHKKKSMWPQNFRVQCSGGLIVRKKPTVESSPLGTLSSGAEIEAVEEHGDWLKIRLSDGEDEESEVFVWGRRRQGDEFYVVRDVTVHDEETIILGVDDEGDGHHSTDVFLEATSMIDSADTTVEDDIEEQSNISPFVVLEDFKGQLGRLNCLAYDTTEACGIKYARKCAQSYLSRFPSDLPLSTQSIGSPCEVLHLLLLLIQQGSDEENTQSSETVANHLRLFGKRLIQFVRNEVEFGETLLLKSVLRFCENSFSYGMRILPKGRAVVRSVESNHPYTNNMDQYWKVFIPGAKRIKIVFDPKTKTETGCDWLCFYKNSDHDEQYGEERYTGRGGSENWPGFSGRPPLWIESDSFVVGFHSDASGTDWGFHFTAYGVIVDEEENDNIIGHDSLSVKSKKEIVNQGLLFIDTSCWLLEVLCSARLERVTSILLSDKMFDVMFRSLQNMPQSSRLRILYLLTSMSSKTNPCLQTLCDNRRQELLDFLKHKLESQYKAEENSDVNSRYLQGLLECTISIEASLQQDQVVKDHRSLVSLPSLDSEEVLIWSPSCEESSAVELANFGTFARKISGKNPSSIRAQHGYSAGVHTWEIICKKLAITSDIVVGISFENVTLDLPLGKDKHSHGWGQKRIYSPAAENSVPFGPKVGEKDTIQVQLDLVRGVLSYRRNGSFVGLALGMDDEAVLYIDKKLEGMFYPAVTLMNEGDEVEIRRVEDSEFKSKDAESRSSEWYTDFSATVKILHDLEQTRSPLALFETECIPTLVEKETQVFESSHPYTAKEACEVIEIPNALRLEVIIDPRSRISPSDKILVEAADTQYVFSGDDLTKGFEKNSLMTRDSSVNAHSINVGDVVVRGEDWDFGDQDGGAGSHGIVQYITNWKDRAKSGLQVKWIENDEENIYRYGYNGYYDVRLSKSSSVDSRSVNLGGIKPISFTGSSVKVSLRSKHDSNAPSETQVQYDGSVQLNDEIGIEFMRPFNLGISNHDLCLEVWFRPNSNDQNQIWNNLQCILCLSNISSNSDSSLSPLHCMILYDPMSHLVTFRMGTAENTTLCGHIYSDLPHINVEELQWYHIAITIECNKVLMYIDGELVAAEEFEIENDMVAFDDRMCYATMGKTTFEQSTDRAQRRSRSLKSRPIGCFYGSVYDFRVWDAALSPVHIKKDFLLQQCIEFPPISSKLRWITTNRTGSQVTQSLRVSQDLALDLSYGDIDSDCQKIYYEVCVLSGGGGVAQIGWAFDTCQPSRKTVGVGDCEYAFAIDLFRHCKWYNGPQPYAEGFPNWAPGDIIGCLLDLKHGTMSFTINGTDLGEAFHRDVHFPLSAAAGMPRPPAAPASLISPSNSSSTRDSGVFEVDMMEDIQDTEEETDRHLSALQELQDLGFSMRKCRQALRSTGGNVDKAIDHLLESYEAESEESPFISNTRRSSQELPHAQTLEDSRNNWHGHGLLRPAASLGPHGTQGLKWNFGFQELQYRPIGYVSVQEYVARSKALKNLSEDSVSAFEVYDHDDFSWNTVQYRHQLCELYPQLLARWNMSDGTGVIVKEVKSQEKNGKIISLNDSTLDEGTSVWTLDIQNPAQKSSVWGYRITVKPQYELEGGIKPLALKEKLTELVAPFNIFHRKHDRQLVVYINKMAERRDIGVEQLLKASWTDLQPDEHELVRWPALAEIVSHQKAHNSAPNLLELRFKMIQDLNRHMSKALPLIDLKLMGKPWSLATLLSNSREFILHCIKEEIWKTALSSSVTQNPSIDLHLSRPRAMRHKSSSQVDNDCRHALFSQAFRQLNQVDPSVLKRDGKVYYVVFLGENAEDAGGPYSETFAQYCSELHSSQLPLLLRTPNSRHNVGSGREKWVLNSSSVSTLQLQMFEFLGKLLGIAIRSGENLALNVASIIWKQLVNEEISIAEDLEAIDSMLVSSMQKMRTIDKLGVTEELFEDIVMENFTTLSSCDQVISLKPGGEDIPVTFASRNEFADKSEFARLHEFDRQAQAVQKGLGKVVPLNIISLFTAKEVEQMVCGSPEISINLLRQCTEYSSCLPTDEHVKMFWEALTSFSHEERSAFLRFTWGRSRLPNRADQFPQWFKLQSFNKSPPHDQYLPVAHTCFFALELPQYSNLDILTNKLRYAIHNCQAIDADGDTVAANQLGWED